MKTRICNVYRATAGTLLLTAALAACTDSREPIAENETPREGIFFSVTATQGEGAETRVTHEPNGDQGMDVKWASGDQIYVGEFPTNAYNAISNHLSPLTITHGIGQTTALFEGNVTSDRLPESGGTLYAIYGNAEKIKFSGSNIRYDYTGQRQTGNDDKTHLAGYDFMTATDTYNDAPGANHSFSFNHVGSMMKFELKGLPINTPLNKLTLSTYDGSNVFPNGGNSVASISLDLGTDNGISLESSDVPLKAYLMVPKTAATADKDLVLYVTTTDNKHHAVLLKGAQIEAQKYYTVEAQLAEYTFDGGGTTNNPYQIKNAGDLTRLAVMTNTGMMSTSGLYFKLTADINMATEAEAWVPIGNTKNNCDFKGTFLGNNESSSGNHSISNLPNKTTDGNAGLFGSLHSATIQNVTVNGTITISGDWTYAGGIAGMAAFSTIENCNSNCTISISSSDNSNNVAAGGIIGNGGGENKVINCTNEGTISSSKYSGGIIGNAFSETITDCTNKAAITSTNADYPAGGIVGYLWLTSADKHFTLTGCKHEGSEPAQEEPGCIIGKYYINRNTSGSGTLSSITIKENASDTGETITASTEADVEGKWPKGQKAVLPPLTYVGGWGNSATGN